MPYFKCDQCKTCYQTSVVQLKSNKWGTTIEAAVKHADWSYRNRRSKVAKFEPPAKTQPCCKLESLDWCAEDMPDTVKYIAIGDVQVEHKYEPTITLNSIAAQGVSFGKQEEGPKPLNHKPSFNPAGAQPINDAITYGGSPCRNCSSQTGHPITESNETRVIAKFVYGLLDTAGVKKSGFMIGVATKGGNVYIVTSTNVNAPRSLFDILSDVQIIGYKMQTSTKVPDLSDLKTRRGEDLSKLFKEFAKTYKGDDDVRDTKACAATRLICNFFEKANGVKMTELAYGAISSRYTDGEAAISCMGCEEFLPMLLCGA